MKEKPDVWMPLVIGDYLKGTARLTTEQHGAYLLLIMDYWVNGPPPDDDAALASITGLELRAWKKTRATLARYFQIADGIWRHKRVDEELVEWTARKVKNVAKASAAAAARWSKDSGGDAPRGAPRKAQRNAPSIAGGVLEQCPASSSGEVEGLKKPSTLSGRGGAGSLADGEPASHAEDSERGWKIDAARADEARLRCARSDPDMASELAEFADAARLRSDALRRERLARDAA